MILPAASTGVELSTVYGFASLVAAAMGVWSFVVAGRPAEHTTLRPQAG